MKSIFESLAAVNIFQMGCRSHYFQYIVDGPHDLELYNGSLHIHTPFKIIPILDAHAVLEIEENLCKINLNFTSERTKVSLIGSGEVKNIVSFINKCCRDVNLFFRLMRVLLKHLSNIMFYRRF